MDVPSAFSRRYNPHSKSRYNLSTFLQGFLSLGYRRVWRWLHWDPAAQLSVLSVVVFGEGLCLLLRAASLVRVRATLTCGDKDKCFQCRTTLVSESSCRRLSSKLHDFISYLNMNQTRTTTTGMLMWAGESPCGLNFR